HRIGEVQAPEEPRAHLGLEGAIESRRQGVRAQWYRTHPTLPTLDTAVSRITIWGHLCPDLVSWLPMADLRTATATRWAGISAARRKDDRHQMLLRAAYRLF